MAYLVRSLVDLRNEVDAKWPGRKRYRDGWYRARGVGMKSEHWPDGKGAVHAFDITREGVDPYAIIEAGGNTPEACWYMIYSRTLYSHTYGWKPRPIASDGPHLDHIHVSVRLDSAHENYAHGWGLWSPRSGHPGPPSWSGGESSAGWDYGGSINSSGNVISDLAEHAEYVARNIGNLF